MSAEDSDHQEDAAPLVDAAVAAAVNHGQFTPGDFYSGPGEPQPCLMKDETRPRFIRVIEEKLASLVHHPDAGYPVDWRRVIDLQSGRLARYIQGAVETYRPFAEDRRAGGMTP